MPRKKFLCSVDNCHFFNLNFFRFFQKCFGMLKWLKVIRMGKNFKKKLSIKMLSSFSHLCRCDLAWPLGTNSGRHPRDRCTSWYSYEKDLDINVLLISSSARIQKNDFRPSCEENARRLYFKGLNKQGVVNCPHKFETASFDPWWTLAY